VELRTERLRLRDYADEDTDTFHGFRIDPDISRYMLWGTDLSLTASRRLLYEMLDDIKSEHRRLYHFLIVHLETGKPMVEVDVNVIMKNAHGGTGYLGYFLNRSFWGQGRRAPGWHYKDPFGLRVDHSKRAENTRSVQTAQVS